MVARTQGTPGSNPRKSSLFSFSLLLLLGLCVTPADAAAKNGEMGAKTGYSDVSRQAYQTRLVLIVSSLFGWKANRVRKFKLMQ